jgi:glycosyltransferase involved in cell wall biosynthesis
MRELRRLRKVGVGLWSIYTDSQTKLAGVARTSLRLLEALAIEAPEVVFVCYVNGGFVVPPFLIDRPNIEFRPIRRYRTFMRFGPWLARAVGCKVWFTPCYDGFGTRILSEVGLIHDVFPFTNPEWFDHEVNERAKVQIGRQIESSCALVVNSQATEAEMERVFPGSKRRSTVVPLALGGPPPQGAPPEERPGGIPFSRYVLTLGTLEPRKNLPALIEAWASLMKTGRYADVGLVVAGGKGWGETNLGRSIVALGIEDRVHFTGYVPDEALPGLFGGCEVFVLASLNEGFGIPVLEAMAYGAPVLSSDVGALSEVGGEACRYFSPKDPMNIEQVLDEALSIPSERAAWIARGRARAAEFGWDKSARATLAVLEKCV